MLSIEEIKLLIEKLERAKKEDLKELIDKNLEILKDIAIAIDANNSEEINRRAKLPNGMQKICNKKKIILWLILCFSKELEVKYFNLQKLLCITAWR